jgi:agmatinase
MVDSISAKPRVNRPFVGVPTFLRAPLCLDLEALDADVAIVGVPTDEGSPFMAGSRFAPRSLREHSLRLCQGGKGYFNINTGKNYLGPEMAGGLIADVGDADILPTNVEKTFDNVTEMVRRVLERGALPVVLGGDHSITYPVVRGFSAPLHVVHFDAHMDYAPFVHDLRFTNGHPFRLIRPLPHVQSLIQVGIRSLRTAEEQVIDSRADGNRVLTMQEFYDLRPKGVARLVPEGANTYVSIDVDVLDMSLVPGCVSAEPEGMTYAELRDTLAAVAERTNVIGFDFVEVNPQLDVGTGLTSYLGAHTVVEFLGHICDQPRWAARRDQRAARRAAKG